MGSDRDARAATAGKPRFTKRCATGSLPPL